MNGSIQFQNIWDLMVAIFRKVFGLYDMVINFVTKEFTIPGIGTFDVLDIMFGAGLIAVVTWLFIKFVLPT